VALVFVWVRVVGVVTLLCEDLGCHGIGLFVVVS